jgi:hypothetical protein
VAAYKRVDRDCKVYVIQGIEHSPEVVVIALALPNSYFSSVCNNVEIFAQLRGELLPEERTKDGEARGVVLLHQRVKIAGRQGDVGKGTSNISLRIGECRLKGSKEPIRVRRIAQEEREHVGNIFCSPFNSSSNRSGLSLRASREVCIKKSRVDARWLQQSHAVYRISCHFGEDGVEQHNAASNFELPLVLQSG